ncbi:MAG: DUF655 domain-containing protein [Desulfurococcales archaeon]|jgi:putative nucleotide binding protein|nr:DUF655 domain-containing protein [Desulfurococcales archaeon]MCC6061969.1 DUF655 domain-containing protein [Desulfurococcales archaeon]NAZ12999.1 DUF655 domain-containing protein [Desulfurococcales archaeon]
MSFHDRRGFGRRPRIFIKDAYALVLDYMFHGNPFDRHPFHRNSPLIQAVGTKYFTLLEISPARGVSVKINERIYVEQSLEEGLQPFKVDDKILWQDLTTIAKDNLPNALREIINSKERVFIEFFNVASPINIRLHMLSLIPGIGRKTLEIILNERKKGRFQNFEDLISRTKISDPVGLLVERIIQEMMGGERYYLFVEPPSGSRDVKFFKMLDYLYALTNYRDPW